MAKMDNGQEVVQFVVRLIYNSMRFRQCMPIVIAKTSDIMHNSCLLLFVQKPLISFHFYLSQ